MKGICTFLFFIASCYLSLTNAQNVAAPLLASFVDVSAVVDSKIDYWSGQFRTFFFFRPNSENPRTIYTHSIPS